MLTPPNIGIFGEYEEKHQRLLEIVLKQFSHVYGDECS